MNADAVKLLQGRYCNSLTQYSRFVTREVAIGDVPMGGNNPIRIQSMTTTDTMDTRGTVEQSIRMVNAGCEYIRITAPSIKEANNLAEIKKRSAEWGAQGLGQRLLQAWTAFTQQVATPGAPWLSVARHQGAAAVSAAYASILGGRPELRRYLNVSTMCLALWMSGADPAPPDVLLKVVDLIVDREISDLQRPAS